MKWYLKALMQNAVALLPDSLAQPFYYQLQRNLGELRSPRFDMRFGAAADAAALLSEHHDGLRDKRVVEVGTGRTVDLPMALWLMGAGEIITLDITRLLRAELVEASVDYLRAHWDKYRTLFTAHADEALVDERYAKLCSATRAGVRPNDLERVLRTMNIDYRSPGDATQINLPDESVDVLISFVVLQHVPRDPMAAILREGRRVLKKSGCMIHTANTSDHFSHVDPSLSPIHFLRWSERQWDLIAGNRFIYQNRMRADDYYDVFRAAGLRVSHKQESVDERALRDLRNGIPLHSDWQGREPERDAVIRFVALLERDDADGAGAAE
jgi:SAM-dependent methyltransferase